jgi:DNA-binding NarL/FixJ family response regulator
MAIRILVVGDVRIYRDGVVTHLRRNPRFLVVGTASDRARTCQLVLDERPDIVLIDIAMAESLEAVRGVLRAADAPRVVALTVPDVEKAVIACAEAGIAGYVHREGSLEDLVETVESVARGECIVSPRMAASLLRRVTALAADRASESLPTELTPREGEIVTLLDQGLSNKQIAARLQIEFATVKNHVHNILEKLHLHRRSEVAARLRRSSSGPSFAFGPEPSPGEPVRKATY